MRQQKLTITIAHIRVPPVHPLSAAHSHAYNIETIRSSNLGYDLSLSGRIDEEKEYKATASYPLTAIMAPLTTNPNTRYEQIVKPH